MGNQAKATGRMSKVGVAMQQWFIQLPSGDVAGPYSAKELKRMAGGGQLTQSSFVRLGNSEWARADSVRGLFESSRAEPTDQPTSEPPLDALIDQVIGPDNSPNEVKAPEDESWQTTTVVASLPPEEPRRAPPNRPKPKSRGIAIWSRKGALTLIGLGLLAWSFFEFDNARIVDRDMRSFETRYQINLRDIERHGNQPVDISVEGQRETSRLYGESLHLQNEFRERQENPPYRMSDTGMYIIVGAGLLCWILAVAVR